MLPKYLYALPLTTLLSTTALTGCSGSNSSDDFSDNTAVPIANAGNDFTASERITVTINASVRNASNNATIVWTQTDGPAVTIADADTLRPNFIAPTVNNDQAVTLEVTLTDGGQAYKDDVTVTIKNLAIDTRETRSYDGKDNNVDNPDWGSALSHLQRLSENDYGDGISSLAGASRPSARVVSNKIVHQDDGISLPNSFNGTDYVWQWGQFIDHDVGLTEGTEETANITVPTGDIFFDPLSTGTAIISFTRAIFDHATGLDTSNPREQENEITSWIDGSMVYGSDETRLAALRVGNDSPLLATSANNLMPFNSARLANANAFGVPDEALFLGGDVRANEQLGLAVMHTLFVREHNRMATNLAAEFPDNTADEVFELTRRLMVAKIQTITYNEWLPALIGADAIGDYTEYDAAVNPTLFSEFSAAAFRLGHSMLNEQLLRLNAQGTEITDGHVDLANAFFTAPSLLTEEDDLDPILRGLALQKHQTLDAHIVSDLRNFLFGQPGAGGLDLASLNIQRGRDHGLPDYNTLRVAMGLSARTSFNEISSDSAVVTALQATYSSVDDIDPWVGGLAEDASGNSQLGELFQAIIVKQFTDLRDGDRFWYENDLSVDELNLLDTTTLAEIIRLNTNVGDEIQDNVFITAPAQ